MDSKDKVKYSEKHPSPSSETTRDKNRIATLNEENNKLRDELKLLQRENKVLQRENKELKQESLYLGMLSFIFLIWLVF